MLRVLLVTLKALIVLDCFAMAAEPENVIRLDVGSDGKIKNFKEPLKIFDNKDLARNPIFLLNNEGLRELKTGKIVSANKVDFLQSISKEKLGLRFFSSGEQVITLKNKGKKYFAFLSSEVFDKNQFPDDASWGALKNESALDFLEAEIKANKEIGSMFSLLGKCSQEKSIQCLQELFVLSPLDFAKKANLLWQYLNLKCDDVEDWSGFDIFGSEVLSDERKMNILSNIHVPWEMFEKISKREFASGDVSVFRSGPKSIDFILISIKTDRFFCSGEARQVTELSIFPNSNNSFYWKLERLTVRKTPTTFKRKKGMSPYYL